MATPSQARAHTLFSTDRGWLAVVSLVAICQAFAGRHQMNSDGLAYLEMAQGVLTRGLGALIQGYFSPGYPAVVAAALAIARPSGIGQFALVHAINLLIFGVAIASWCWWLASGFDRAIRRVAWGVFALLVFKTLPLQVATPDMIVLAVVIGMAAAWDRLAASESVRDAVALGAIAGAGYWAKAIMFPAAMLFLLIAFALATVRRGVVIAAATWCVIVLPLVLLTTGAVGHLSYGETGSLNYAWYVSGATHGGYPVGVDGSPADAGLTPPRPHEPIPVPTSPIRLVTFDEPTLGAYPLQFDPSFWNTADRPRFRPGAQIAAIRVNAGRYWRDWFVDLTIIPAVVIALLIAALGQSSQVRIARPEWVAPLWGVGVLAMYALVHVESRLVAPFVLLLLVSLLRLAQPRVATAAAAAGAVTLAVATVSVLLGAGDAALASSGVPAAAAEQAGQLAAAGLCRGDTVAILDRMDGFRLAVPSHLAGVRLTAAFEHWPAADLPPDTLARVRETLTGLGIAGVLRLEPPDRLGPEWRYLKPSRGAAMAVLLSRDGDVVSRRCESPR